jgi:hypothetical protein
MAYPRALNGEDLQIWRVAVNFFNMQWWTADKGWCFSLGIGQGQTTLHHIKPPCHVMLHRVLDLDRYFEITKQRKMDMRFGTWNVRSLYRSGSLKTLSRELNIS